MSKSKANTRRIVASAGGAKGGAKGASESTAGAGPHGFDLQALNCDAELVVSAGVQCGMSADDINQRLIAAAIARAKS